jgi:DNA-binding transcriptional LysR family regulator
MTQPAVTFQVRQLEEYFDTRLFDRTHNRISLTDAGTRAYGYAEKIFELYGQMENAVREMTGKVSGALVLGASTTVAEYMLPALLGEFKEKFPEVEIHLKVSNTDGVVHMIENNDIDLGLVEAPVSNKNLVVDICKEDELVVIIPPTHALSGKQTVTLEEALEHPFICREEGSGTREVISDFMGSNKIDPSGMKVTLELGSPESVKGAVEAGMGISIVSRATISKELELGSLLSISLDPPLKRPFAFVHQKQKFRQRSVEELLEFAQSYCERG